MRVRVLRSFIAAKRGYRVGEVIDVSFEEAHAWAKSGLVMQDKSLDGAGETKVKLSSSPKPRRKSKKRTK